MRPCAQQRRIWRLSFHLTPSTSLIGPLRTDLREGFGLPDIQIAAWSGDNPCSLVGTGLLEDGQLAISSARVTRSSDL